jgi:hypothetical protein
MGNFSSSKAGEVYIDLEGAKADGPDAKIYNSFNRVLGESKNVLQLIEDYKGCRDLARKAMSAPTKENELAAFEGLLHAVDGIQQFFNYSNEISRILPEVLVQLASKSLAEQQALATSLARLFDFSLVFDQTRMMRPNLSNDFSYYRRLLPKFSKHPDVKVKDDEASGMALFTAEHIPMIASLTKAAQQVERPEAVQAMLASFANSCMKMLKGKKFSAARTQLLCARGMTGAIVLYDRLGPASAFSKRCPIALRDCLLILKRDFAKEGGLLNAIQFSTKNYKDAPASIQDLFD